MSSSFDGKQATSDDAHKPFSATSTAGNSSAQRNGYNHSRSTGPAHSENPLISVQPPRREDLQPSYAQVLQGDDDTSTNGWYGSMSTFGTSSYYCAIQ